MGILQTGGRVAQRIGTPITINGDSPFAAGLRVWFPLSGNAYAVGPHRPAMDGGVPKWGATARGVACENNGGGFRVLTALSQFTDLNGLGAFTLGVRTWVRGAGGSNFGRIVTMQDQADFALFTSSSQILGFSTPGFPNDASPGNSYVTSQWADIIAVYDSGVQKAVWINGVRYALTTRTGTLAVTTEQICIGNRTGDFARGFDGFITDVALWTYALPDSLAYAWYDPATRWDLYWQPGRRVFFDVGAAAATAARARFLPILGTA